MTRLDTVDCRQCWYPEAGIVFVYMTGLWGWTVVTSGGPVFGSCWRRGSSQPKGRLGNWQVQETYEDSVAVKKVLLMKMCVPFITAQDVGVCTGDKANERFSTLMCAR